jgi:hypothetical protein
LPVLQYVNKLSHFIGNGFGRLVYNLVSNTSIPPGVPIHIMDTSWNMVAALAFLFVAVVIAVTWTLFEKRKAHPGLLAYMHTFLRYYLVFVLFYYGIGKLFISQFQSPPSPAQLLRPVLEFDPHRLFWLFMGTSKSYQFFAGLMEVLAGVLLLFRRTSLLGAFLSLGVLGNTLMLNIGYDTQIKLFLLHLILISFFIIYPDINKLYRFFIKRQPTALPVISSSIINNTKYKWLPYILKFSLISFFIFLNVSGTMDYRKQELNAPYKHIAGLYEIKEWRTINQQNDSTGIKLHWKKMAIDREWGIRILTELDSLIDYDFNKDSSKADLLYLKNENDANFIFRLRFKKLDDKKILFQGVLNKDSIHFISTKIDLRQAPLFKTYGRVKWVYD